MEKKNTGFKVLVTIISLGITFSLFGKFNIIEKVEIVMSEDKEKQTESPMQNPTPEPIPETDPNPTTEPASEPIAQPTAPPLVTPETTDSIDLETIDRNPEIQKMDAQIENNPVNEEKESENESTSDKSPSNFNQDDNNFNETNKDEANTLCQLTFESPGKLIMTTNEDDLSNHDSTVDIKCDSGNDGNGYGLLSYNYSDLVNNENSHGDQISYISVSQGTYIVNFINCNFDNVNFYFVNSNDMLSSNSEESYEEIVVPTSEDIKVEISKDNPTKIFKVRFDHSFKPMINFYSDDESEENLALTILDGDKSELQYVELNYTTLDGSREVIGDFSFDDGKEYYIQVSCIDNVELPQTCYIKISQSEEDDQ